MLIPGLAIATAIALIALTVYVARTIPGPAADQRKRVPPDVRRTIAELQDRLDLLEEQRAADRLRLLDTAEKVARRLTDRDRKRAERAAPDDDDDDDAESPGDLLAVARLQYPLPGFPGDVPVPGDER